MVKSGKPYFNVQAQNPGHPTTIKDRQEWEVLSSKDKVLLLKEYKEEAKKFMDWCKVMCVNRQFKTAAPAEALKAKFEKQFPKLRFRVAELTPLYF